MLEATEEVDGFYAGQLLGGRYELLIPIARGGMGQIWIGRAKGARGFKKLVAVKTLFLGHEKRDDRLEEMMSREAQLIANINHPNVVETLELGEENGSMFMVMELVYGESLSMLMSRCSQGKQVLPLDIAISILHQTCLGLHAAHELSDESGTKLNLVHRDISPQNIMVGFNGIAKLIDFGIAKLANADSLTHTGELKGKFTYMAPEQWKTEGVDRRVDIFSFGVVMYLATTGQHPFKSADHDINKLILNVLNKPAPPPSSFIDDYPPELERIVLKALEKEPEKRYQTALELADDLRNSLPEFFLLEDRDVGTWVSEFLSDRVSQRKKLIARAEEMIEASNPRISQDGSSSNVRIKQQAESGIQDKKPHSTIPTAVIEPPAKKHPFRWVAVALGVAAVLGAVEGRKLILGLAKKPVAVAEVKQAPKPVASVREYAPMVVYEGAEPKAEEPTEVKSESPANPRISQAPKKKVEEKKEEVKTEEPPHEEPVVQSGLDTPAEPIAEESRPAPVIEEKKPEPVKKVDKGPRNVSGRVGNGLLAIDPTAGPYRARLPAALSRYQNFSSPVRVCVGEGGRVTSVAIGQSMGVAVDASVRAAIGRWVYRPLVENGEAVSFCYGFVYEVAP